MRVVWVTGGRGGDGGDGGDPLRRPLYPQAEGWTEATCGSAGHVLRCGADGMRASGSGPGTGNLCVCGGGGAGMGGGVWAADGQRCGTPTARQHGAGRIQPSAARGTCQRGEDSERAGPRGVGGAGGSRG